MESKITALTRDRAKEDRLHEVIAGLQADRKEICEQLVNAQERA
jgi:hypothetical protein